MVAIWLESSTFVLTGQCPN